MLGASLSFQSILVPTLTVALSAGSGAPTGFAPLDSALVLFGQRRYAEALPLFEEAVTDSPRHALARCAVAETKRRLDRNPEAARDARFWLAIDRCSACAHSVLAECYDPLTSAWEQANAESAWAHFTAAAACDPRSGDAWLGVWRHAIARGDSARERKSLEALSGLGWFTPALIAYGRWQLAFLPQRAVLLTRGDLDSWPSAMLQGAAAVRPDVAVVNLSLLDWPDYARAIGRRAALPLPAWLDTAPARPAPAAATTGPTAERIVAAWADSVKRGALPRPLIVGAGAARIGETPALRGRLTFAGPYYTVASDTGAAEVDSSRLAATVAAIDPPVFAGPWTAGTERQRGVPVAGAAGLGANLLAATLRRGLLALDAGDAPAAIAALAKLDSLTAVISAGEVMRARIRRLRAAVSQH
jgi:tetratricopeptide (TPR) repeat protein